MIQVENLALAYSGEPIFEDVSFVLNPQERCGLVGRNGSGKTTLFRILIGKESQDSGTVSIPKGYKLGYLDQHIKFTKPTLLEEACLGLKPEERDEVYRAERILSGLGFDEEEFDKSPTLLSGGYSLRLHLAKVLLSEPDCLLLDEPTNYLDILSIRFLMKFLRSWKGELILISHDREFMDAVSTHTMGLHRKRVKKIKGGCEEYFAQILQEEEVHEKTRIKREKERAHLQSYIDRFGAKASKAAQAQSRKKKLEKMPALEELKKLYDLEFHFHEKPFHGRKLLEAKEIEFSYGSEPLIEHFSLAIERGEKLAIIGKNGYGKSTLLKLLMRELTPKKGETYIADQASIGYFGQTHIQRLDEKKTIEEEIASANPTLTFSEVKKIAGQMMFSGDLAKKKIGVLSGGERSRVLIGKILAYPCNLLLLDEPTHHFDIESVEALIDALEEFNGASIIVTHSELILKRLNLHKLVICHADRQEIFLGNYDEFLEKKGWEEEKPIKKEKEKPKQQARPKKTDNEKVLEKIMALESEVEKLSFELAEHVQKNNLTKIQEFNQAIARLKNEIDELYRKI